MLPSGTSLHLSVLLFLGRSPSQAVLHFMVARRLSATLDLSQQPATPALRCTISPVTQQHMPTSGSKTHGAPMAQAWVRCSPMEPGGLRRAFSVANAGSTPQAAAETCPHQIPLEALDCPPPSFCLYAGILPPGLCSPCCSHQLALDLSQFPALHKPSLS